RAHPWSASPRSISGVLGALSDSGRTTKLLEQETLIPAIPTLDNPTVRKYHPAHAPKPRLPETRREPQPGTTMRAGRRPPDDDVVPLRYDGLDRHSQIRKSVQQRGPG